MMVMRRTRWRIQRGRGGAVRGTTYLAGGRSRILAARKVPRQSPIVVLVKICDD
jgi:hypothetical protein